MLKASLFGVPLPLCSCGVIPVSMSLHKHGASKGATVSFLLSTPPNRRGQYLRNLKSSRPCLRRFQAIGGTVLVTGPATNAASFITIWKALGRATAITYLATVAGCALLGGLLLDYIAVGIDIEIATRPGWMLPNIVKYTSAVVLLAILSFAILSKRKAMPNDDTVSSKLSFRNIHYFAAGATQFAGKVYNGRFGHVGSFDTCTECHDAHDLGVKKQICSICHGVQDPHDIRKSATDFDGDGDTQEGIAGEIKTLHEALYAAIQDYAANVSGTPIVYGSGYPYIFIDTNGNGVADEVEISRSNRHNAFTVRLLQATYNYQCVKKDPGAFAHNGKYAIQVLYDSLEDLGADMTGMVRP